MTNPSVEHRTCRSTFTADILAPPQTLITVNLVKKTTPSVTDSEETGTDPLEIAREIAMGVILRPRNRYDQ